jgi:hypothetical protein
LDCLNTFRIHNAKVAIKKVLRNSKYPEEAIEGILEAILKEAEISQ